MLINSQDKGLYQVRDLSESWGEDMLVDGCSQGSSEALRDAKVCPTTPSNKVPAVEAPSSNAGFMSHEVFPLTIGLTNGSHDSHTSWLGAQSPCVRGSNPPTVTLGFDCRPCYLIPAVRRIDTLAS